MNKFSKIYPERSRGTKIIFIAILFFGVFGLTKSSWAAGSLTIPAIPSLADERATYASWGLTWDASAEPNKTSATPVTISNPDIHGDTEGDDLWTNLHMYRRTGQRGYLERAKGWARYFKDDYLQCVPGGTSNSYTLCDPNIEDAGWNEIIHKPWDHLFGWGLIDYYLYSGDSSYLTAAINIGEQLKIRYDLEPTGNGIPPFMGGTTPSQAMAWDGARMRARHLLFMTRLAEVTGDAKWATLRDKMINMWLYASDYDSRGMYFAGIDLTNYYSAGLYESGVRVQSAFQMGIIMETFYQAYRTTGNAALKQRIIDVANFIKTYALDPTYQQVHSYWGLKNGTLWGVYTQQGSRTPSTNPPENGCGAPGDIWWDPVYSTSMVNSMMIGYKLTGDVSYYNMAKTMFLRGANAKGYGSALCRNSAEAQGKISHFADSQFDTGNEIYFAKNKGELQYTYMLFEQSGSSDTIPPAAPTGLSVN